MCQTEQQTRKFERVTCSRCGGSGRYSYCQTMNGPHGPYTCFKCNGVGEMLTKRGRVAYDLLVASLSIPAEELKPGDRVRYFFRGTHWFTVTEARPGRLDETCSIVDGDRVPSQWVVNLEMPGKGDDWKAVSHGLKNTMWRVAHNKEEKSRKIELAYDYQELLTKQGKPMKKHDDRCEEITAEIKTR